FLDLNYPEDFAADIDFNVVMNDRLEFIEVQGTAEAGSFTRAQLNAMLDFAEKGIEQLMSLQTAALSN
ncbi:MAG: ribonuclease PH, partial [Cyanobacteria bacterium J06559_3]